LRITCTVDLGASVVAALVARFVEKIPGVRVEVHATNALVDLIGGGFDLAIRISPRRRMADSSLVARRVGVLETRLVAAPAYLARRGHPRAPRDLERHQWVTYAGAESIVLEAPGSVERLAARGAIRCDDMLFAHAAARAGAGIALLPSFLAKPSLETRDLVAVLPKWKMPSGALWLVHPGARNPPAKVSAFCEFAFDALAQSLR
jgi:DNA-binding transcriptional LysR family regulator